MHVKKQIKQKKKPTTDDMLSELTLINQVIEGENIISYVYNIYTLG